MSESRGEHDESLLSDLEFPAGAFDLPDHVAALRERVLRETTQVVRGHRRRKRTLRVAGWGMAYAAGVLSAWFGLRQLTESPREAMTAQQTTPETKEAVARKEPSKTAAPQRRTTPEELRARVAGANRDEQIDLLRRAGDLYLNERNDLRSAVTCYQQVLELAETPEQLAVLPDDSWLLAELKQAQRTQ